MSILKRIKLWLLRADLAVEQEWLNQLENNGIRSGAGYCECVCRIADIESAIDKLKGSL